MGAIIAFSGELAKDIFPSLSKIFPVIVNVVALVGVFTSFPALQTFGRKNSIQYGNALIILCLFGTARCFGSIDFSSLSDGSVLAKILMMLFLLAIRLFYSITLGPVVWVYTSEIVQAKVLSFVVLLNWIVIALVNLAFPIQKEWVGGNPEHIFDFYSIMTLICYLINRYTMIETANKSEIEIRR